MPPGGGLVGLGAFVLLVAVACGQAASTPTITPGGTPASSSTPAAAGTPATAPPPSLEPEAGALPTPACPAPAEAVRVPPVTVVLDGQSIVATAGSSTLTTCSTVLSTDAVPAEPVEGLDAAPGDRLTLVLPEGWQFVGWEGHDQSATGEGINVWPPQETPGRPRQIEVPVPVRTGPSIAGWTVRVVGPLDLVVGTLEVVVRVTVAG